jgi:Protein of unknown function (DUF3305)
LSAAALFSIPVGVVVERRKATSPWLEFVWQPVAVLPGVPAAEPWTTLGPVGDAARFFAGTAAVHLYRTETANYIGNLASEAPLLWVVLRPTERHPPYEVVAVTADPAEGEAFTEAGDDLVDTVPMPAEIRHALEAFVAEHHVARPFFKRQRDGVHRADARSEPSDGSNPREEKR